MLAGREEGSPALRSADDFARLHEQLLELKMQNQELEEDNRRARRGAAAGAAPPPASAAALGRSLADGIKASTSAFSAFGAPLAASLRSSLAAPPASAREGDDVAALRTEAAGLRERARAALEGLAAARAEAMAAQQRAAAAAADSGPAPPAVTELRRLLGTGPPAPAAPEGGTAAACLGDATLERLARAIIELAAERGRREAGGGSAPQGAAGPGDGAEDGLLPLMRIQQQQRDLERLREAVDSQGAVLGRLREQAAVESARHSDKMPLEERLKATERHVGELGQRLETFEGVSRQLYELRCHLHVMLERVQQRDRTIEQMLAQGEQQDATRASLREQLSLVSEDLLGAWERDTGRQRGEGSSKNTASRHEGAGEPDEPEALRGQSGGGSDDASPLGAAPGRPVAVGGARADAGVQVEPAACAGRSTLRAELEGLRAERAACEARGRSELQDLRTIIRNQRRHLPAGGPAHGSATRAVESYHIGSDVEDGAGGSSSSAALGGEGMLYKQKIAELLELHKELERELELLRSSEQCLRADQREKEELIAYLLRQVRAHEPEEGSRRASEARAGKRGGALGRWWSALREQPEDGPRELEREAEEALLDNERLRRHLRCLSEELARAMQRGQHAAGTDGEGGSRSGVPPAAVTR